MYLTPSVDQRAQVQQLLEGAPLSREQKLNIALAAGLRELMAELREQPRFQPIVHETAEKAVDPVRPWWRRWRRL
jgi:hypothetical protein